MSGMAPSPGIPPSWGGPVLPQLGFSWVSCSAILGPCPPSRLDDIVPLPRTAVVLTPWSRPSMGSACISMGVATRILPTGLAAVESEGTA